MQAGHAIRGPLYLRGFAISERFAAFALFVCTLAAACIQEASVESRLVLD